MVKLNVYLQSMPHCIHLYSLSSDRDVCGVQLDMVGMVCMVFINLYIYVFQFLFFAACFGRFLGTFGNLNIRVDFLNPFFLKGIVLISHENG